ncbi:hypothetical protein CKO21_02935 [Rhodovibrio salinarum]|uniref:ABC transmembrane type-1 domain-containing protein n=1 Tax=Rhodovibrio salinarum TaxID=1087 RepID=A0A934QG83_9PROT|nr:hypothetical protein [Rhodovibrio salinarum]
MGARGGRGPAIPRVVRQPPAGQRPHRPANRWRARDRHRRPRGHVAHRARRRLVGGKPVGRPGRRRRQLSGGDHPRPDRGGRAVELIRWSWVRNHLDDIGWLFVEHIQLASLALLFGVAIAFPLALAALRWPRLYGPLLGFTGVLFTIPSLALFILLIPYTGLSKATSLIGLTIYTLLILVRNIVEGLRGVSPHVLEAAKAMGLTRTQRLFQVELPLALPMIMAGIRIAAVTTIGLVTVTALIGQGGLGRLFIDGFTRDFATPVIVGFVLSVALAIVVDLLLVRLQSALTPWHQEASDR